MNPDDYMNEHKSVQHTSSDVFPKDMYRHAHGAIVNDKQFENTPEAHTGKDSECHSR